MTAKFIPVDRDTPSFFPPTIQEYLAEDHMARFVVEIVDQLDVSHISDRYKGRGKAPFHPSMLIALLFYGYSTGTFSSRKLEAATYDSIAYRYICANTHPDHDTINQFRKKNQEELRELFNQVLLIAHGMGLLKLGTVSLDGTKIKANASKHKALSWGYMEKLEAQLQSEVEELMALADEADQDALPEGLNIPEELERREQRLQKIAIAKAEIQRRAKEKDRQAQVEYQEKLQRRRAMEENGQKPRGKEPKEPATGPKPKDQVNLTDDESRIMPSKDGYQQAYNAQASVDIDTHLIVEQHISQNPNDKQEIEPALARLKELPDALGKVDNLLGDTGYFSETNVSRCHDQDIKPYLADGRQKHNTPLKDQLSDDPSPPDEPTQVDAMRHRMKTREGKQIYAKRKSTVETVFGNIKQNLGFRQFLLRGRQAVEAEWSLVCIGWNLKRMYGLRG